MEPKLLKSALKFWQEIAFLVPIGLLLIEITKWVMRSQTMDGWNIFLVLWFLPLFICLLGQFFWKNEALAITLSLFLGLSSVVVILMAFYGIINSPSHRIGSIVMLIIGVVCIIATFTMPIKYIQSGTTDANNNETMETKDHFKNGTHSKRQISREKFLKKHKDFFIIGLTILASLAFWLTIAYFDEGYNRFPVNVVDYFFVILYALFFPIIPVVSVYLLTRSSVKGRVHSEYEVKS